jgi:2-oxoglutarate/2-oxoacid ferredoxin oxidoreductase subunit beta
MTTNPVPEYSKKDMMSDQLIRWCPGCGDYSILSQTQTVLAQAGIPKEEIVIISGIGCSSRFPYYMNTYGFHTIHGRAPTFATGLKTTRPELSVWIISGDGDALSIGGNHLIHLMRRNVNVNLMLFDNRIYGLTKGQYSPTSEVGKRTKSTPMGSIDTPFNPIALVLGAGASFVGRSVDVFAKHLRQTLNDANAHDGTSLVHIYQNCNIFNDGAFADFTQRKVRDDRVLYLENGAPLVYGKEEKKGLVLDGVGLKVVTLGEEYSEADCVVHDTTNLVLAQLLATMKPEEGYPVPVGTFYQVERPTYDSVFRDQVDQARKKLGQGDLESLINAGDTWTVE